MKKNSFKKSFTSRRFKMGGFQTLWIALVVILVIVINMLVGKMNITVDLSSDKIYTLTEDTKNLVSNLSSDIRIYYMVQDGNEAVAIEKVLDEYARLSHIQVEKKDPVTYPNFSKTYTDDEIQDNDVIVVNEEKDKSRHISYSDMLVQNVDYTTYSQTNSLDAEGQITAAIESLTQAQSKKIYATSGHGETQLDSEFINILTKSNMTAETLATSKETEIPEDCDILIINGPKYDFSEDEYKMLSAYVARGGKGMFFLNPLAEEQPNFKKLLSDYGVDVIKGYVVDNEQCFAPNYPTYLAPDIEEHEITDGVDENSVIEVNAVGLTKQSNVRSSLNVEPLLKTSVASFSRVDEKETSLEMVSGDIHGPFNVAAAITDTIEDSSGEETEAKLVVYGSYLFGDKSFTSSNQFGNRTMLVNSLSWLSGAETGTLAIPARSLDVQTVSIDAADRVFFTTLLVILVPLALIGTGFVIWYRRRKR